MQSYTLCRTTAAKHNSLTLFVSWLLQIVGVIFPVLIMALVPIRQYILPRFFSRKNLHALDAAEYEEAPPESHNEAAQEAAELGDVELVSAWTASA